MTDLIHDIYLLGSKIQKGILFIILLSVLQSQLVGDIGL